MLGLLHRISLGNAPSQLRDLFPLRQQPSLRSTETRLASLRHSVQFLEPRCHTEVMRRSLFGLVVVYNLLPEDVVRTKTVSAFQSRLQTALKRSIFVTDRWPMLFSSVERPLGPHELQSLFAT